MIRERKILGIIPARGQSKGVPRKNLSMLCDKPLIAWTIEAAKRSRYIDRLVLSSDDPEIISVARDFGCEAPFVRPAALAQDATPGIEPVLHAIEQIPGYDYVVLLQPTSPLRTIEDIDGCIEQCVQSGAKACVSVSEVEQHPRWMYTLGGHDRLVPIVSDGKQFARRQDLPPVFLLNGAVYVAETAWLQESHSFLGQEVSGYVMPPERSLDIDTLADLERCEKMMAGK